MGFSGARTRGSCTAGTDPGGSDRTSPRAGLLGCVAGEPAAESGRGTVWGGRGRVGGGPGGAVAARAAARAGARVLVVERSPHRPPRCTGLVGPTTLDLLALPPRLVLRDLRAVRVVAPGGAVVEFRAPDVRGYVLDRRGLDRWLLERAAEAGAEVWSPATAVGLSGRRLHTTGGAVEFGVLVAADGAASAVRRWVGLPSPGELLVGVQAEVEAPGAEDRVEVHLGSRVAPGGFAWVVPAGEGVVRVGLLTVAGREAFPLLDRFVASRFAGRRVLRREGGLIPIGPPATTSAGRALVVGDAAGQVKPLSGGGLLFGAIAARIAGEVAAGGADALPAYEARWRAELGEEIAFGLQGRRAFFLADRELDRIVLALDRPAVHRLVAAAGDIDRPSRLVRALLSHPSAWGALFPVVRAVGGWVARERGGGLSTAPPRR
ncbi:NAD(P)/FAD-dependent oxidoreductase [Candidatus Bipolaricaulota bacterium]|nr:NAD(P)/FAD-dependent oxidoreductase [Candidatus Bipolaricaulota bacterium]